MEGADKYVSDGVRGCECEKQPGAPASKGTGYQDCSGEKECPLQIERDIHQVRQRRVDHLTLRHTASGHPEIADVVTGVAVWRPKGHGDNGFQNEKSHSGAIQSRALTAYARRRLGFGVETALPTSLIGLPLYSENLRRTLADHLH